MQGFFQNLEKCASMSVGTVETKCMNCPWIGLLLLHMLFSCTVLWWKDKSHIYTHAMQILLKNDICDISTIYY